MRRAARHVSQLGQMVEGPLLHLASTAETLHNIPPEFVLAYLGIIKRISEARQQTKPRDFDGVLDLYISLGLLATKDSEQRAVPQPADKELATLIEQVDSLAPLEDGRAFRYAYAALVESDHKVNSFAVYLINAVLAVSRELVRHTEIHVSDERGTVIARREKTLCGQGDTLVRDVHYGVNNHRIQLDAVIIHREPWDPALAQAYRESTLEGLNDADLGMLMQAQAPYSVVNVKFLTAASDFNRNSALARPRSQDLHQFYDQLASLIYNQHHTNPENSVYLPQALIFLYASPLQDLSHVSVPINRQFLEEFSKYLVRVSRGGRLPRERAAKLQVVHEYIKTALTTPRFAVLDARESPPTEPLFPATMESGDFPAPDMTATWDDVFTAHGL